MGLIERIEVENFKSYMGKQVIGPFKRFTAVIGPNGSGKSNLMDAISFVLGVSSRHLRGNVLKDLIYKVEGEAANRRRASVKLVYKCSGGEELEDYSKDDEIHFKRLISTAGVSSYRIDDVEVSFEKYVHTLSQLNINTKARNCLIFQGDVENIASKNPRECTKFLEHISGSDELEEEYDSLKSKMEVASNNAIFNFQKKKGVSMEKKELKEQKDEAEAFTNKQNTLNELKTKYFLFKLFHIDNEIDAEVKAQDSDVRAKEELDAEEKVLRSQVEDKKADIGGKALEAKRVEKEVAKCKAALKEADIKVLKMKDEKDFLIKHKKELDNEKEKFEEAYQEAIDKRDTLARDIKADIDALEQAAEDMASSNATLQLDESQMKEYEKIRADVGSKTAKIRSKLQGLQLEFHEVEEELHRIKEKYKELEEQRDQFIENKRRLEERKTKVQERVKEDELKIPQFQEKIKTINNELEGAIESFNKLESDLEEVATKLSGAKQDNRESASQKNMQIAIDAMKRLYPGVLGRLFSLCKPRQTKYNMAVTTALGMWMDAIVVETEETAKLCMKYLRDQRVGTAHFLPLNSLRPKPINERYRNLGSKYKLALDVLEFDESLEIAVKYACGNAVIANTLEDARQLAFTQNEKVKVVSLDGSVISKSGNMTGGVTSTDEKRAERWEEGDMEKLRSKKREIEREKENLRKQYGVVSGRQSIRGAKADEMEKLQTEMKSLQNRIQYSIEDVKLSERKLQQNKIDLENVDKELDSLKPHLSKLEAQTSAKESSIHHAEKELFKVEDSMFANFCAKVGMANIREYETSKLAKNEEVIKRKRDLHEHKSKLEAALAYEESRDLKGPLNQATSKCEQIKSKLAKFEKNLSKSVKDASNLKSTLEEKESEYKKLNEVVKEKEIESKVVNEAYVKAKTELTQLMRSMNSRENTIAKLRALRKETITQAFVDKVTIVFTTSHDEGEEEEEDEGFEVTQTQDSSGPVSRASKAFKNEINYTSLPNSYKNMKSSSAREESTRKLQDEIGELTSELSKMQPNMKASDQYGDVEQRLKNTLSVLEEARTLSKQAEAEFEKVKGDRANRFNEAYSHIKKHISGVYKDLTKDKRHPTGGEAYLDVDDIEEPFSGGVRYHTIPPGKQFRDMEQLSGGEKTVAALALLFSIHSYKPSPFFIMDEIDAALDNTNVSKVSNYIRKRSDDFQCIVISLKDQFYSKADSVIGIYRDRQENCSKSVTLDLSAYSL